jgi:hypothetical protein
MAFEEDLLRRSGRSIRGFSPDLLANFAAVQLTAIVAGSSETLVKCLR